MGLLKAANTSAVEWVDVEKAPYPSGYEPVMALAQNHVFFLNVAGVPAGSTAIYVIHCKSKLLVRSLATPLTPSVFTLVNYFQPNAQAFSSSNGAIPATHGRTASFFRDSGVWDIRVVQYTLHSFHRIISASGTRRIRIHPR